MTFRINILTPISQFLATLAMVAVMVGQVAVAAEASFTAAADQSQIQSYQMDGDLQGLSMSADGIRAMHTGNIQEMPDNCGPCESGCENICISSCQGQASVYQTGLGQLLDYSARTLHGSPVSRYAESAKPELNLPPPRL